MAKSMTPEEIEAGKTAKGGFTRKQLAEWGVPWPPPRGWRRKLLGDNHVSQRTPAKKKKSLPPEVFKEAIDRRDRQCQYDHHALLRKVVSTLISNGHASDIYDIPEALEYFEAKIPDGVPPLEEDFPYTAIWQNILSKCMRDAFVKAMTVSQIEQSIKDVQARQGKSECREDREDDAYILQELYAAKRILTSSKDPRITAGRISKD
jgi:hypothetical protein